MAYTDFLQVTEGRSKTKAVWKRGKFVPPLGYLNGTNSVMYQAKTDWKLLQQILRTSFFDVPRYEFNVTKICRSFQAELVDGLPHLTAGLEAQTFPRLVSSDEPVVSGGSLLYWHLCLDGTRLELLDYYKDLLLHKGVGIEDINRATEHLGTTCIFTNPTMFYEEANVQLQVDFNKMIDLYKRVLSTEQVELRCYGTTRYITQIMHTVLVCPQGSNQLEDFPLIQPDEVLDVFKFQKREGRFHLTWCPYTTIDRSFTIWDQVAIAFYFPHGGPQSLPLLPEFFEYHRLEYKTEMSPQNRRNPIFIRYVPPL